MLLTWKITRHVSIYILTRAPRIILADMIFAIDENKLHADGALLST